MPATMAPDAKGEEATASCMNAAAADCSSMVRPPASRTTMIAWSSRKKRCICASKDSSASASRTREAGSSKARAPAAAADPMRVSGLITERTSGSERRRASNSANACKVFAVASSRGEPGTRISMESPPKASS